MLCACVRHPSIQQEQTKKRKGNEPTIFCVSEEFNIYNDMNIERNNNYIEMVIIWRTEQFL